MLAAALIENANKRKMIRAFVAARLRPGHSSLSCQGEVDARPNAPKAAFRSRFRSADRGFWRPRKKSWVDPCLVMEVTVGAAG
jgi:hypothetical protein